MGTGRVVEMVDPQTPSEVSVICRVTYFQFPTQSAFLPYIGRQATSALQRTIGFNTQYRTLNIAKFG